MGVRIGGRRDWGVWRGSGIWDRLWCLFTLEIEKLYEDVFKVGKIKVHCITMIDKLHLVSEIQYNVRIYVENNNILSSIMESFDLEHFKVLVVFYDRKSFYNFIESFK